LRAVCFEDLLSRLVEEALKKGASYADARAKRVIGVRVEVVDGYLREAKSGVEEGLNVRVLVGGAWGFASAPLSLEEGLRAVEEAVKAARVLKPSGRLELAQQPSGKSRFKADVKRPLMDVPFEEKVELALKVNREMLSYNERVKSASTVYSDALETRAAYTSHGRCSEVEASYVYFLSSAYAEEAGLRQRGFKTLAGVGGFEVAGEASKAGVEAASLAVRLLSAPPPPAGKSTCILDPEIAGTFIHEAFGHACEADLVLAGASILEGRIGQRVGSELVTVIDDPSIKGLYGWTPVDDEATEGRSTAIVERGVLKGYLHSLETASKMKAAPTGNARSQGYANRPIVRMTNTYIAPGDWKPEELMEDTESGLYIKGSSYGYVDTAKGLFSFKCKEAYLIERGEPTKLLRDVALSGLTLEVLSNVDAVANDLRFNPGICGKEGQHVPVTDGSPHIRVKEVLVGGAT